MTTMDLGNRLKERRERAALTQEYVAKQLGLSREVLSTWETGTRKPNDKQLENLAVLYRTDLAYLKLGRSAGDKDRQLLLQDLPQDDAVISAFTRWLDFLDSWAGFLQAQGDPLPGPGKPPRALDQGGNVTDARKAPTFALEARHEFKLAFDAIHDLETLLDEQNVLVYKTPIESMSASNEIVSGAFYNHPRLGYCIFVNTKQHDARIRFTLAHEFAHALYHYRAGGIISRNGDRNPRETFANAFASHFLVPGKALREQVNEIGGKEYLDSMQAFRLAWHFNVSYAMMLFRLHNEKLISMNDMNEWASYNVGKLAKNWGIRASDSYFAIPANAANEIAKYPISVLKRVKLACDKHQIEPDGAAALLSVSKESLVEGLLQQRRVDKSDDLLELHELLAVR
ncbi:helix-turn-helix domain-containing protein [Deinococcus aetherius]|nr:XRE family transcriptional regulator [Deinococcus aetherius]